jgi:hypothetical protein
MSVRVAGVWAFNVLLRVAHYFRCRCWVFWLRGKRLAYDAAAISTPVTARQHLEMPNLEHVPQITPRLSSEEQFGETCTVIKSKQKPMATDC